MWKFPNASSAYSWNAISRLKGIETPNALKLPAFRCFPWNAFSRLKGIETLMSNSIASEIMLLECLFPFEGN